MTPETKQALEAFVLQIIDAAKTGATWTAEQTPLLVQEWLRWQLAEASIILVFGLLAIAFAVYWIRNVNWWLEADDPAPLIGGGVVAILGGIFALVTVPVATITIAKVLVAPRVVVFEKFIELVK